MEGLCTNILKTYRRHIVLDKFTVYCLNRPSYNQCHLDDLFILFEELIEGQFGDWDHHEIEEIDIIISQNDSKEINQFIGDRCGILKSHFYVIVTWQVTVIV